MRRITIISLAALTLAALCFLIWKNDVAQAAANQMSNWSDRFRLKTIQVSGTRVLDVDDIRKLAGVSLGKPLFLLPIASVKSRLETHPWVRSATVQRRFPDTMIITIREREAVAALRGETMLALTTDSMAVMPPNKNWVWNLPILTPPTPLRLTPGTKVRDTAALSLLHETILARTVSRELWSRLSELYYRDKQIHAMVIKPQVELILNSRTGILAWQSAYSALQGKQSSEFAFAKLIDLRVPGKLILSRNSYSAEERISG